MILKVQCNSWGIIASAYCATFAVPTYAITSFRTAYVVEGCVSLVPEYCAMMAPVR